MAGHERTWDEVIGLRLAAGDPTALREAYDHLAPMVFGLARRMMHDTALAEDITQDVFCQLWERPDRFDAHRATLRSFLAMLTRRRSIDRIRSIESARRRDDRHASVDRPLGDVADQVGTALVAADLHDALQTLPEPQRHAISLAYFGGHTFREVAAMLDISEGTAKSRIRLGLGKLRLRLSDHEGTEQ